MDKHPRKTLFVNIFGSLGYISCLFLWGWTGLLYLPLLLENEYVDSFLLPDKSESVVAPMPPSEPSPALAFVALFVTALVVIATIVVLLKAPVTVAMTGKTMTTKAANSALPIITRGRKLQPDKKRRLTANLIKIIKLILLLLPVSMGLVGAFITMPLPFELRIFVSSVLALCSVLWFSLQYITARLLKVETRLLV